MARGKNTSADKAQACSQEGIGMSRKLAWRSFVTSLVLAVCTFGLGAVATSWAATGETTSADERMTARVDALLAERWKQAGVEPAPPADDTEFLRRASLDLTGVIPTVAEVREF